MLDIETSPALSYHWRTFKENIGVDQIVDPGGTICFAAKWVGEDEVLFYSDWEHGHKTMVKAAHALLSECDAVVHVNGKKFDIPHLMTEFILAKLDMPPPLTQIDVQQIIREKFRLLSNKLAFIGPFFNIGKKMEHEGFMLWRKVLEGDRKSQEKMQKYCIQDMELTERVYFKILPFITKHPRLREAGTCRSCGGNHFQKRGFRYTPTMRIQRLQCQGCKSWQEGKREKIV